MSIPDSGLVICDKTSREPFAFPTQAELREVVRQLPRLPRRGPDEDVRRYALLLSPASVTISFSRQAIAISEADYEAPERSSPDAPSPATDSLGTADTSGHEDSEEHEGDAASGRAAAGLRTEILEWSRKSRASMVARLCSLDYSEMFAPLEGTDRLPAMVTLTYPGDWRAVVPDGVTAKRHLAAFRKRFDRRFKVPLSGLWKMEFQRRGAVHFHLFCVPPAPSEFAGAKAPAPIDFRSWLSQTWTSIVDAPDPQERANHLAAGTGVDWAAGARFTDPKRVAVYFAKHSSANFGDKEYQNRPPQEWIDAGSVGRFWGYWRLSPALSGAEISGPDAVYASRILRRWSRANSRPRRVYVWRVVTATGEAHRRRVQRRVRRMSGTSGFVTVNDGVSIGRDIVRALELRRRAEADYRPPPCGCSPRRAEPVPSTRQGAG